MTVGDVAQARCDTIKRNFPACTRQRAVGTAHHWVEQALIEAQRFAEG
jgi:hypothetical protein